MARMLLGLILLAALMDFALLDQTTGKMLEIAETGRVQQIPVFGDALDVIADLWEAFSEPSARKSKGESTNRPPVASVTGFNPPNVAATAMTTPVPTVTRLVGPKTSPVTTKAPAKRATIKRVIRKSIKTTLAPKIHDETIKLDSDEQLKFAELTNVTEATTLPTTTSPGRASRDNLRIPSEYFVKLYDLLSKLKQYNLEVARPLLQEDYE